MYGEQGERSQGSGLAGAMISTRKFVLESGVGGWVLQWDLASRGGGEAGVTSRWPSKERRLMGRAYIDSDVYNRYVVPDVGCSG